MTRSASIGLGLCAAFVCCAAAAAAADWSARSFFSLRAAADTAFDDEDDDRLTFTADVGVIISATTPTSTYTFAPGLRGTYETGDDAALEDISPRFNLGFSNQVTPLTGLSGSFSFVPTPVRDEQFDDTGETGSGGLQLTTSAQLGLNTQIDPLNSLNFGASARRRDFTDTSDTDLVDNRSYGVSAGWSHTLDPVTTLSLTTGVTYFEADDDGESISYSLSAGGQRQMNPRLSLGATLGVSAVDEDNDDSNSNGLSFRPTGSFNLNYAGADYSARAGLSQSVDQRSTGEVVSLTALTAGLSYTINPLSRINLVASAENQLPIDGDEEERQTFRFSPSYAVSLTPEWEASAGYQLRVSNDDDGTDVSNGVFVQISRSLNLLP